MDTIRHDERKEGKKRNLVCEIEINHCSLTIGETIKRNLWAQQEEAWPLLASCRVVSRRVASCHVASRIRINRGSL